MDINVGWWYLLGCVLSSSLIPIIFREVQRFPVPLFQVITWNYVVCVLTGLIFAPEFFEVVAESDKSWVPLGIFQGALFISLFFMIARGVQTLGIVIAVILTKLSVIIPTLLSWVIYDDPMNGLRWAGVALALVAIVLLNLRSRRRHTADEPEQQLKPKTRKLDKALLLALVLFFGSATTDSVFKIFNAEYGALMPKEVFVITLFGVAGILGQLMMWARIGTGRMKFHWQGPVAGVILGVPNFFSIWFLLAGLEALKDGTVFFPINNVGQVLLAAVLGLVLYCERLSKYAQVGIAVAILAVGFIAYR